MQSLLRSMTPQQRAELQSMMDALLRDDRLRWDLARLASNMDQLMPDGLGEGYDFSGEEPLGPRAGARADRPAPGARRARGRAGRRSSRRRPRAASTATACADLLGDEAARDLEALDELARRSRRPAT